jgi:tetratricopeptide (TPR) repeat protein
LNAHITIFYYLSTWLKASFLASATGLFLGYMGFIVFAFPYGASIGLLIGLAWGQVVSISLFWGPSRGLFEYENRKYEVLKKAKTILIEILGWLKCQRFYLEEFGEISWSEGETYDEPLKDYKVNSDDRFFVLIRAAQLAINKRKYDKAIKYLQDALRLNPSELVVNFMLGQSFERTGKAEDAVCAYTSAMDNPLCVSDSLKKYVKDQIERIETKGPLKKPPMPGLRHLGMGR